MKNTHNLMMFAIATFFASCDKEVGEHGIVKDAETNVPIENVIVKMRSSEQGTRSDVTDVNGYFNVVKTFSCGIASCNTEYNITFTTEGYETLTINDSYYRTAEYVNQEAKDTLLIKLMPLD